MDDVVAPAPLPTTSQDHLLRRRSNSMSSTVVLPINLTTIHHQSSSNSISATPTSSSSTSTSSSLVDFDFISIKPVSYISLRDLLPSTPVNSPKPNSPAQTGSDISIKNRLVKQAAWAYLQPMSTCPDSSARNFLHRLWSHLQLLKNQLAAFRDFFDLHIFRRLNQAFDWLLRAVRVRRFS
ncbi:uncharacterized protein LOC113776433 [Coffea eugenioides]|uniref:uncharacterized protein LOC113776433 n=1 Tax=Coffea eugenioides TaxID=49369 RepID=UPI000F60EB47|nr:uncharacterized protein LOC113776433 [Coffea eugenioides]